MNPAPMHDGQLTVTVDDVRALIAEQFPRWSHEPVAALMTSGTVNAIFRVGDRVAARFPLVVSDADAARRDLETEAASAGELASATSVPTPVVLAIGDPGDDYPGPWTLSTWLDGTPATPDSVAESTEFALELAAFILELRAIPVAGRLFSGRGRGGDLRAHDDWMRICLDKSTGLLDVDALARAWATFRELPRRSPDVMSHTDLIPANLLVEHGRLVGVLDVGGFGPADPALDLVAAWHVFDEGARHELRGALGSADLEWARGAAWAFAQAMGLVWYYRESNPTMSALGRS
ncbi:MAG TPA: aminoglycoside phosphotransferase family protein, partial [Humibacter sp.]|nr:aminoglycoside phosphotransferase family protein [Humibacter sp.]